MKFILMLFLIGAGVGGQCSADDSAWNGEFMLIARNPAGEVLWSETRRNALADAGELQLLDVFLRGASAPAGFYVRLFNDTPAETDTLADLTGEPSGNGYAAIAVERSSVGWPTLALASGDYQAVSKTVTFLAAGGQIGPILVVALSTSADNTGWFISYAALSQPRTLAAGDSLEVTYRVKLQ